jgi:hypothetical protein
VAYADVRPDIMADPSAWDRVMAFKEVFLRQGSCVLWAYLAPEPVPMALARFVDVAMMLVRHEISAWELGRTECQPGLHMTVMGTFADGLDDGFRHNAGAEMDRIVLDDIKISDLAG